MDALQKRLMEMEERNPSMSAIESNKLSQLKLFLRDKLNLVKETSQKSLIGEVGNNDYHITVPEESHIEGVKINDGSVSIRYKNGSSATRFIPEPHGYIPDLLKAKRLAEKGNPQAEFYLDRATKNYFQTRKINLVNRVKAASLRDNLAFNLKGEILTAFKEFYSTPSSDVHDFLRGVGRNEYVTAIADSIERNKDTREEKYFVQYSIVNKPESGNSGKHANINVEHDLETGITSLRRRAFSEVTFVDVSIPDQDKQIFEGLYSTLTFDPEFLLRKKAQLKDANFSGPVSEYLKLEN
jgi:hypothetical protein